MQALGLVRPGPLGGLLSEVELGAWGRRRRCNGSEAVNPEVAAEFCGVGCCSAGSWWRVGITSPCCRCGGDNWRDGETSLCLLKQRSFDPMVWPHSCHVMWHVDVAIMWTWRRRRGRRVEATEWIIIILEMEIRPLLQTFRKTRKKMNCWNISCAQGNL